jgi:hypothetical protein
MHSRYVIADVSLPNPNVFYELGIRHAIRAGTILIKDKAIKSNVFDISHLRYIEYDNTPSGLKELSQNLSRSFLWIDANPTRVDNQFLELANFTGFRFPQFIDFEEEQRKKNQALISVIMPLAKNPDIMKMIIDPQLTQEEKNAKFFEALSNDPKILGDLLVNMVSSGFINQASNS